MATVMSVGEARVAPPAGETRGPVVGLLVPGLVWYGLIALTWLLWWRAGPDGREAVAQTMGLTANQFGAALWPFLILENILAKALLIAAFYRWMTSRPPGRAGRERDAPRG